MNRSTNLWSTAVAAAALFALPVGASAQSTTPPQQPPAQSTQPPTQPPSDPAQPAAAGQVDQSAAKQHLTAARDSLSQLTSLPEAAKLQGDARTQVSQLISNFNELITTQANWRSSYDKVAGNLTALLGPDTADPNAAAGTAGAVGTSGTAGTAGTAGTTGAGAAAPAASIDPAIRAKLTDFRTHLKAFEQTAGGSQGGNASQPNDASSTMPPSAATGSTSNPANPAQATGAQPPASATGAGVTGATGTSGATGATGTSGAAGTTGATMNNAEVQKHLDAIDAVLAKSKTGTLTKAQTTELKKHVAELRRAIQQ